MSQMFTGGFGTAGEGGESPQKAGGPSVSPGAPGNSTPPPFLAQIETVLDCSYKGGRVRLPCPGADTLDVFVEGVNAAIGSAILKIKAGADENAAAAVGVNITSTGSTQTQTGIDITGKANAYVEVDTAQSDLIVRVVVSAMKS